MDINQGSIWTWDLGRVPSVHYTCRIFGMHELVLRRNIIIKQLRGEGDVGLYVASMEYHVIDM